MTLRIIIRAALALAVLGPARAAAADLPRPAPPSLPMPVAAGPEPSLNVLTFNTWGLPFPIARPRGQRFPRIRRFLADMSPDVAGLQEVWRGARKLLPLEQLFYPRGDHDSGLAVLSSLPMSGRSSLSYDAASGVDRLKDKGAMKATVEHPDLGSVHVVVTHLQAGRGGAAQRARSAQIEELLAFVDELDGPAMVMGDFNLYDTLPLDLIASQRLAEAGFIDAAASIGVDDATHGGKTDRLDRVYLRELVAIDAEVLPAAGLSDHHPLRVEVGRKP